MDTLRVLFAFRQQDGAAPRKLKNISLQIIRCLCQRAAKIIAFYNKRAYIEQAIILPLI